MTACVARTSHQKLAKKADIQGDWYHISIEKPPRLCTLAVYQREKS